MALGTYFRKKVTLLKESLLAKNLVFLVSAALCIFFLQNNSAIPLFVKVFLKTEVIYFLSKKNMANFVGANSTKG